MKIDCPCCGARDLREFTYIGDALRKSPTLDADFDTWAKYVWERENPRGKHREFWQHTYGCRQFLDVERDTVSHEIHSAELVGPFGKGSGS